MTSDQYAPSREDRFSFGLWTVGWQGVDVFGGATRAAMPPTGVRKLAESAPTGSTPRQRRVRLRASRPSGRR